ncbi:MAG: zinc-dependent peptidase, partial [Rhizobiales bacterium]|nr:zinc-dependent peptidase [Rhizobacter sp.]
MRDWLKRLRETRTLTRRAIPDALWLFTLARFPFLGWRSESEVAALRDMATLFLADKEFTGAQGLQVDDEMAVAIAAQACLPALKLGLQWYDGFKGIVVHAAAVVAQREVVDDDGVVHAYEEELSGEAMHGGPVMLAWRDVDEAG